MVNVPQVIINLMVLAHTTLKKDMWARIQKVNKILALTTFLFTSTTLYSSFEMPNFFDIIVLFITADDDFHIICQNLESLSCDINKIFALYLTKV